MGKVIGEPKPVPPDDPMFKQGPRLVGINKLRPLTKSTEKSTAGEAQTLPTSEPKEEK